MPSAIERRLAKVERAMNLTQAAREAEEDRRSIDEWRAAGGPMSFVVGRTRSEAEAREQSLRKCGMIQPLDKVHLIPSDEDLKQSFYRHLLLEGWNQEKRDRVLAALQKPGRPYPPEWEAN